MPPETVVQNYRKNTSVERRADSGSKVRGLWVVTRLSLAFIFLWAFFDKMFGLGYSTPVERAWINGGSPIAGFLGRTAGPASGFFQSISGSGVAEAMFMVGLFGIGTALAFGIGLRIAAWSGALLMMLMWAAVMPASSNPLVDDHIVYAAVLLLMPLVRAGDTFGFGAKWRESRLVRAMPILE